MGTITYRDPSNCAFFHRGTWYRIASPESADAIERFRASSAYADLRRRGSIVDSSPVDGSRARDVLAAFASASPRCVEDDRRVFEVESIELITYPWEWPDSQLIAAGRLTLDVRHALLDLGLDLKDASAFNVQFRGVQPIFVDLGSIEQWRPNPSWNAARQFVEHFVNPLSVASTSRLATSDLWRIAPREGLRSDIARSLLAPRARRRPSLWLLQQAAGRSGSKPPAETHYAADAERHRDLALRATRSLTTRLSRALDRSDRDSIDTTWNDYGAREHYTADQLDSKLEMVRRFIQSAASRGAVVLDIGGNDGLAAIAAREAGADRVVVLDPDHGAIGKLNATLARDHANADKVTPVVGDVTMLTSASGLLNQEFRGFHERIRPSAVLCHAVIHHLVITQGNPVLTVVAVLASFNAPLQLEFPTEDDDKVRLLRSQIPNWEGTYDTDAVLNAMVEHFVDVRIVGETTPTRLVIEAANPQRSP